MVETQVSGSSPVESDESSTSLVADVKSVARRIGNAIMDWAVEYARAREASALAEAHRFYPARMRNMYVNDLAEPPKSPPEE
jgi:hypothetical protein